jgi:hypothetical protein
VEEEDKNNKKRKREMKRKNNMKSNLKRWISYSLAWINQQW